MIRILWIALLSLVSVLSSGQKKPFVTLPVQLSDDRFADWIVPAEREGVFCFRKKLKLETVPHGLSCTHLPMPGTGFT